MKKKESQVFISYKKKNRTTILTHQHMLVGDLDEFLDMKTQYLINTYKLYPIYIFNNSEKLSNIQNVSVYSTVNLGIGKGAAEFELYPLKIKNIKKPQFFIGAPTDSTDFFKLNELINMSMNQGEHVGKINIKSGKICFFPLIEIENHPFPKKLISSSKTVKKNKFNSNDYEALFDSFDFQSQEVTEFKKKLKKNILDKDVLDKGFLEFSIDEIITCDAENGLYEVFQNDVSIVKEDYNRIFSIQKVN